MKDLKFSLLCFVSALSYFVVIGVWLSIPEELTINIVASLCALSFTTALILSYRKRFFYLYTSSFFKNFTSSLISCSLIFFILGLLNYLAFKNPLSWDVSKNGYNSLTKQTENILRSIKGPTHFYVFANKKDFSIIRRLTELYRLKMSHLDVTFIDANLRPDLVKSFSINKIPSLVLEVGAGDKKRRDVVQNFKEEVISRSLYFLNENKSITFYFTQGHGEIDLRSQDNEGGSAFAERLMANNYTLKTISLNELKDIPKDMDALVIWGPKSGFFKSEFEFLRKYIDKGGHLIVAFDPMINEDHIKDLRLWFLRFGLKVNNDVIIDTKNFVNGSKGSVPFIAQYNDNHAINKTVK